MSVSSRRAEIATGLGAVRSHIAESAMAAGREPGDVTLVVVTKTFPADDIRLLHELGVRDVGENRHPEAGIKAAALADLDLTWHFVGRLQTNKAGPVASYADVVESVDSDRLARRLGASARRAGRTVGCLVQANLDPGDAAAGRGGAAPDSVAALADTVAGIDGLVLCGVMGVAPLGQPAAPAFKRLADLGRLVRLAHPGAHVMSAGMSGDFPEAIAAGATHVRVGSAILGRRPALR